MDDNAKDHSEEKNEKNIRITITSGRTSERTGCIKKEDSERRSSSASRLMYVDHAGADTFHLCLTLRDDFWCSSLRESVTYLTNDKSLTLRTFLLKECGNFCARSPMSNLTLCAGDNFEYVCWSMARV